MKLIFKLPGDVLSVLVSNKVELAGLAHDSAGYSSIVTDLKL